MMTSITERKKLLKRLEGFRALIGDGIDALDPALVSRLDDTIAELKSPVRIVIAGLAAAHHHTLVSLLGGTTILRNDSNRAKCPPLTLRAGRAVRTGTLAAGRDRVFQGCVVDKLIDVGSTAPIRLDLPTMLIPHAEISVLPVYDGQEDKTQYLLDMVENVDAIVWCSDAGSRWSPNERRLWFIVPDDMKARSLLVLTGSERLEGNAEAQEARAEKEEFAADDFTRIVPVLTDQAESVVVLIDALCTMTNGTLLDRARVLRKEISTIPIGTDQIVPLPEPPPTPIETIDPAASLRAEIVAGAKACLVVAEADDPDSAPVFEAMTALLGTMTAALSDGVHLTHDHDALVTELGEATDLVALLGFEETPQAMQEAADLVRQLGVDILDRLPMANDMAAPSDEMKEAS